MNNEVIYVSFEDHKKISIILPELALLKLQNLANKERHTVSQQVAIIIMDYLRDYDRMLEIVNEDDFGVITEEKLRSFLKRKENQINYIYVDIEHYSFEELFKLWIENFSSKK